MGVLDGPMRNVSKKLLDTFGTEGTLTHTTTGAYNTSTGASSTSTSTSTVTGTLADFDQHELGGPVEVTDLKYTIPAKGLSTAPDQDDTVTIDSVAYQVINVRSTYSGDQVAMFELQLRA